MGNFYVVINSNILSMKKLTDSDKIIYSIICNLTDRNGVSHVRNSYIEDKLKDFDIKFTKIAQGVPTGVSLENVDILSLSKAIQSKVEI